MSNIYVKIDTIPGDSRQAGYEDQIACESLEHGIDLQVVQYGSARVEGASVHSNFELTHKPDKASPLLRLSAAAATQLGTVVVTRTRKVGESTEPAEIFTLENARVALVEMMTPVNNDGTAVQYPLESFHLEYESIGWDYKYRKDGEPKASVFRSYNRLD